MFTQSRETLPVASTDTKRRIQYSEAILAEIERSLLNPDGLSESSEQELRDEIPKVERAIQELVMRLTVKLNEEAA